MREFSRKQLLIAWLFLLMNLVSKRIHQFNSITKGKQANILFSIDLRSQVSLVTRTYNTSLHLLLLRIVNQE